MKTCSVCLRGNHSVYGIYCWPLCSLFVPVCKREHSVFMCVCGRVYVWLCWCAWVFLMRSERASRVCIVVLEEVEEDEPSSSPPPPRPKSSPDRRSHHASRRAAAQEDKVRRVLLFWFVIHWIKLAKCESAALFYVNDSSHQGFKQTGSLIPGLKFWLKCIVMSYCMTIQCTG